MAMSDQALREKLDVRFSQLETARSSWSSHWSELSEYILPFHSRFLAGESSTEANNGKKRMSKILDSQATRAVGILAAGLQSGVTSPVRPWFRLKVDDVLMQSHAVRLWVEELTARMLDVFSSSNTYNSLHQLYWELPVFGTGAMALLESEQSVLRCRPFSVGEYWLSSDHEGKVDAVYRKLWLSARQMVEMFGEDAVSEAVKTACRNGQVEQLFLAVHLIGRTLEHLGAEAPRGERAFPVQSLYWERNVKDKFLRVSGYETMPCVTPRWDVVGTDTYGFGPGMVMLPDVKGLQKLKLKYYEALDKVNDPPMLAPTAMKGQAVNVVPGGITFSDEMLDRGGLRPTYQINPDLERTLRSIDQVKEDIRQGFYNDLFLMIANSNDHRMTATEVATRNEEKLLMLGPVLERLHDELLRPMIDRTFELMLRAGIVPPPPPEAQGQELNVEYVSILAQAQKMVGVSSMQQFVGFVGNLAAGNPAVLDKVDFDAAIDKYAESTGVAQSMVVPTEVAEARRASRAKQAQQAQAMQVMAGGAQSAKVLSEAKLGQNSALDAVLGGVSR